MSCSQDSAFCVPVCGKSESACDGPVPDHVKADGKKQCTSREWCSTLQPEQLQLDANKSHAGAIACPADLADSNESVEHGCGQNASILRRLPVSF